MQVFIHDQNLEFTTSTRRNEYNDTKLPKLATRVRQAINRKYKTQGVTVSPPLGNFVPKFRKTQGKDEDT